MTIYNVSKSCFIIRVITDTRVKRSTKDFAWFKDFVSVTRDLRNLATIEETIRILNSRVMNQWHETCACNQISKLGITTKLYICLSFEKKNLTEASLTRINIVQLGKQ